MTLPSNCSKPVAVIDEEAATLPALTIDSSPKLIFAPTVSSNAIFPLPALRVKALASLASLSRVPLKIISALSVPIANSSVRVVAPFKRILPVVFRFRAIAIVAASTSREFKGTLPPTLPRNSTAPVPAIARKSRPPSTVPEKIISPAPSPVLKVTSAARNISPKARSVPSVTTP